MINSDYLDNLNNAQKEAVLHIDGPLLIVAGAGSGKTKVLTSRIAHIIKKKKAYPNQILSVTFTNKAAKEMQTRVSKMLGSAATGLSWLGTFHSICAKILRKHATAANLNSNFTIVDTDDQIRLIINIFIIYFNFRGVVAFIFPSINYCQYKSWSQLFDIYIFCLTNIFN